MEGKELALRSTEWEVANFDKMLTVCEQLVRSGFLPAAIKTPQQAAAIILTGREVGIPSMQALRQIVVIQGKPTISPELMLALAYQRIKGFSHKIIKSTAQECEITFKRAGCDPHTHNFTLEDAKNLGLIGKDNWNKQPKTMLRWRCISAALRLYAPDAIFGMYTPEELSPDTKVEVEDVTDAKPGTRAAAPHTVIVEPVEHVPMPENEAYVPTETVKAQDIVKDAVEIFEPTSVTTKPVAEKKPPPKAEPPEEKKKKAPPKPIRVENNDGKIQVFNSYRIKEELRARGFRWNAEVSCWEKPYSSTDLDEVQKLIEGK